MEMMAWVWLGAMVFFALIEAMSFGLVSVWFAVGSIAAMISVFFGAPILIQLAVFVVFSGATMIAFRPLFKRIFFVSNSIDGIDRLIGMDAVVIEEVSRTSGKVTADGKTWNARIEEGIAEVNDVCSVKELDKNNLQLLIEKKGE